jgi:uncharacterized repeat protein (TIGR03803 family)
MNKTTIRLKVCILAVSLAASVTCRAQNGLMLTTVAQCPPGVPGNSATLVQESNGALYGAFSQGETNAGSIFRLAPSGSLTTLASFYATNGAQPYAPILAPDGYFYGVTYVGGSYYDPATYNAGYGTIYRMDSNGVLTSLFSFDQTNGQYPQPWSFVLGSDGSFYGATGGGGTNDGTIFKITTNGDFTLLVSFNGTNGSGPTSFIQASDGNFYGTTFGGGTNNGVGTVFKMTPNGQLTSLAVFYGTNGANPNYLTRASDGCLYGTTLQGGLYTPPGWSPNGNGVVFKVTTKGDLSILAMFDGTNGANPTGLTEIRNGVFYCTTEIAAVRGGGELFQVTSNGDLTHLLSFGTDPASPAVPIGPLTKASDGNYYGYSQQPSPGAIYKLTLPSCPCTNRLMLTTVYTFYDNPSFEFPEGGLIQATDGMLYGITQDGGAFGGGSVFRTTFSGSLTNLVSFNGTNGDRPIAPPVQAADGNFYGTTGGGGSANYGTIYRMDSNGVLTTLFNFNGTNGGGAGGASGLIVGNDGALYGVSENGGPNFTNVYGGDGTIFKITTNGDFTPLASFYGTNGSEPISIIQASDGNFYGTTIAGGINNLGTVFQMTPAGQINTLFRFNGTNGGNPVGLIQASDGCLYGTTSQGGATYTGAYPNFGNGTVFKVTTNGDFTLLASLSATNGASPRGGLIEVCPGLFYGTAYSGGFDADPSGPSPAAGGGTVFQVTTNGDLTALALFGVNFLMPENPLGRLLKASDGNYYGTSQSGGTTNFNQYGSAIESAGGIFAIRPVQAPVLQPLAQSNQLNVSWNAWAGYSYAVMYETNLTGSNWFPLTTNTPQINGTTSFSDPIGPDTQRFYEVILQLP